jgi:BA14K-like protein
MSAINRWMLGGLLGFISMMQTLAAAAMPMAGVVAQRSDIVDAQVTCDARGCFSFGPRQSYRPPSFRPPDYSGGTYYKPRGTVVQPFVYRPQPANPAPATGVPATAISNRHKQWCEDRYKSYSRITDLYKTQTGHFQPCQSPYD